VANWAQVGAAALRGDEVTWLTLRNGLEIESAPGALLVPLYKEIVYKDDYRLRSDPLPRGAVVVDIGANLGMFALHVAADSAAASSLSSTARRPSTRSCSTRHPTSTPASSARRSSTTTGSPTITTTSWCDA